MNAEKTSTQGELFATAALLDSPLYGDVKGERTVAEFPFFALSKVRQMTPMVFDSGPVKIRISPSELGVASIYDKEILLYIASLMTDMMDRGERIDRVFRFTAHDLFRVTSTNPSARSYDYLKDSLRRLQGTQIVTNIETGGEGQEGAFSWLLKYDIKYSIHKGGERKIKYIEVMLCDWFHRAVLTDRRIAAYDLGYFELGPIERRLYELAMFNCMDSGTFEIEIRDLAALIGCSDKKSSMNRLRMLLLSLQESDTLPEYMVEVSDVAEKSSKAGGRPRLQTTVRFRPRPSSKKRRLEPARHIRAA